MEVFEGRHRWEPVGFEPDLDVRFGGQARVLRVRDENGMLAAVKEATGRYGAWLEGERRILEQIASAHPGSEEWLVNVLDYGVGPSGRPWMALPWYEHNLRTWISQDFPRVEERLRALELAVDAVRRLNEASPSPSRLYVHRDVKPDNFLVQPGAHLRVVLADLGGAKEGRVLFQTRVPGTFTPGFAPLEQRLGMELAIDRSVDVHGLAATIYEALAECLPPLLVDLESYLSPLGRELRDLHHRNKRSEAEQARYEVLRTSTLEELVENAPEDPLTPADRTRFVEAIRDDLVGRVRDPDMVATLAAQPLLDAIGRSLAVLPRARNGEPRHLAAACESARELIEAEAAYGSGLAPVAASRQRTLPPGMPPAEMTSTLLMSGGGQAGASTAWSAPTVDISGLPDQLPAGATIVPGGREDTAPRVGAEPDTLPVVVGASEEHPEPRRRGGLLVLLGLGALGSLGGLAALVWSWQTPPPLPVAVVEAPVAEPSPAAPPVVEVAPEPATVAVVAPVAPARSTPKTGAPATAKVTPTVAPAPEAAPPTATGVTLIWSCSGDLDATFAIDGASSHSRALPTLFAPGNHGVDMSCSGEERHFKVAVTPMADKVQVRVSSGAAAATREVPDGLRLRVRYQSDVQSIVFEGS